MDLRYLENIIRIYEEKSITKAAEKSFITQSALNQQLMKLETELGTPVFKRSRSDWQLTEAGEAYIAAAKSIVQTKKDTYKKIRDIANINKHQIHIGLIPERGINMFTSIYPKFHRNYPTVLLEPVEANVRTMQKQISSGEMDLGLITLRDSQKDENLYIHMADEEILLAVPATHPLAYKGSRTLTGAPDISLAEFRNDSFVLIFQTSTMHELEQSLFEEAGFQPRVLFSTSSNLSKYRMVSSGVGCTLLPSVFAAPDPGIAFFRLEQRPFWEITMCCRKGAYLSKAEEIFLEHCRDYWNSLTLSADL